MHKMLLSFDLPSIFAQTSAPAGPGGNWTSFLPFVLIMAAMWFLMIAPQRKKQKEHQKMIAALKSGDEVLTTGGLYGTIVSVREDRLVVRIGDNTKVEVAKAFVQGVENKSDSDKKSA